MMRFALISDLLLAALGLQAQYKKRAFSPSIGYARKLDSFVRNPNGVHIGINMYRKNASRFSYDVQLSANLTGNRINTFAGSMPYLVCGIIS